MKKLLLQTITDLVRFFLVFYFVIGDPRYITAAFASGSNNTATYSTSSLLLDLPDVSGDSAGYLNGDFSVNEGGSAIYQTSITVPPGTNGMEPKLGVVYDSRGANGLLGLGFSLSGLSAISRCATTKAQDGFIDGVDFDENDKFCLDGQRLVVVQGEYGANGSEYRTENETFSKITSYTTANSGPDRWEVKTKSGLLYNYGNSSDSKLEAFQRQEAAMWLVNKVSDSVGNYQTFHYNDDSINGESYPLEIKYSGNEITGTLPYNKVVFEYENREDPQIKFVNGAQIKIPKRLSAIKMLTNGDLAWEYDFTYRHSATSKKSQLMEFQECDASGNCMLPTTFDWQEGEKGFEDAVSWRDPSPLHGSFNYLNYEYAGGIAGSFFIDMNNDLLPDRVAERSDVDGEDGFFVEINNGSGFEAPQKWWEKQSYGYEHNPRVVDGNGTNYDLIDMNRDNLPDKVSMIVYDKGTSNGHYGIWVALNNGSGFGENRRWFHDETSELYNRPEFKGGGYTRATLVDMNNDLLPDRVTDLNTATQERGFWVYLNNGSGFDDPINWWQYTDGFFPRAEDNTGEFISLIDVNADGLPDRVLNANYGDGAELRYAMWVSINNGSSFNNYQLWYDPIDTYYAKPDFTSTNNLGNKYQILRDVNGDGLPDRVVHYNHKTSQHGFWIAYNTGMGFTDLVLWQDSNDNGADQPIWNGGSSSTYSMLADLNLDGIPDRLSVLKPNSSVSRFWVALGNGTGFADYSPWLGTDTQEHQHLPIKRDDNGTVHGLQDFNGDGILDRIAEKNYKTGEYGVWVSLGKSKPELLAGIKNGHGYETTVEYSTLMDDSVYQKDTDAEYPIRDIRTPMNIVKSYSVDNGLGGKAKTSFKYYGLKMHVEGRGMCGFRQMETINEVSGVATTTYYRQDHPYKSLAFKVETRLADGTLIKEVEDTWDVKNFDYGSYFPHVKESIVKDYQLSGALLSESRTSKEFDDYGNVEKLTTSELGGYSTVTENEYDTGLLDIWHIDRLLRSTVTKTIPNKPSISKTAEFEYNSDGLLTLEVNNAFTQHELKKIYKHDVYGNIKESITSGWGTDFLPIRQFTYYDEKGQFAVRSKNHFGHEEVKDYDNRHGKAESLTGPNGIPTSFQYDGFGRTILEVRADGTKARTLQFLVDESVPDAPSPAVYYIRTDVSGTSPSIVYYDILDRELRKENIGFDGTKIFTDTVYNERGEVERVSDPYFKGDEVFWTVNEYDVLGRLFRVTDATRRPTRMIYDGLTTIAINPLGQKETREENQLGQLIKTTDNLGSTLTYDYDADGNLVKTTDPAGNITTMGYDVLGNKIWMQDSDTGMSTYNYNSLGQLLRQEDAKGQVVTFSYDVLGRMVSRSEPEGISSWVYDTKWIGALSSVTSPGDHFEEYFYDEFGRVDTTEITIDNNYYSIESEYDSLGRLSILTYPRLSGAPVKVANQYNEYGYLESVYNDRNPNQVYWTAEVMNAKGQLQQSTLGNGLTTNKSYDPITGHLEKIKTGSIQDLGFTFDTLGNLKKRADNIVGASEILSYDEINRLTKSEVVLQGASGYEPVDYDVSSASDQDISLAGAVAIGASGYEPASTVSVSYDVLGNILTKSDVGTYKYGENGAGVHAVTSISGDKSNTYQYDANGNRISDLFGTVDYSSYNKPIQITKGQEEVLFEYSANRSRYKQTQKRSGNVYNTKYYIGGLYEREISSRGDVKEKYFIKAGGSTVAINIKDSQRGEKILYLLKDHLGSVQTITDTLGLVTEILSFDAWGKRRNSDWSKANGTVRSEIDRGFTGHEQLDSVGLVHMNGRVYDPEIGRFLSADPFIQAPENIQSYNRYSYVLNNPLSYSDPSGFFFKKLFKSIKKAIKSVVSFVKENKALIAAVVVGFATGLWISGLVAQSFGYASFAAAVGAGANGAAAVFAASVAGGAAGGFAGSFTGAAASGAKFSTALKAGLKGGVFGAASAGIFNKIGGAALVGIRRVVAHGTAGGAINLARGGKFQHGFISAAANAALGGSIDIIDDENAGLNIYRTAASAVVGGSISQLSGGKFANGAVTSAFARMFNDDSHKKTLNGYYDKPNVKLFNKSISVMGDGLEKLSGLTNNFYAKANLFGFSQIAKAPELYADTIRIYDNHKSFRNWWSLTTTAAGIIPFKPAQALSLGNDIGELGALGIGYAYYSFTVNEQFARQVVKESF